jgi:dihydropteroate synthase
MGIINVTPDSFSDGGQYLDTQAAVDHGLRLVDEGADVLDVGGESTRPGADLVSEADEIARVVPVIAALAEKTDIAISVDTTKAEIARQAIRAGCTIINDVSAMTADREMAHIAAESSAGVILMHMRGTPRTMQDDPSYDNVVVDVREYLAERAKDVISRGVRSDAVALDPGIGFGKTVDHNLCLLAGIPSFLSLGFPVVVGLSRKSFLGKLTGRDTRERLPAALAASVLCAWQGAHVLRTHDVWQTLDAVTMAAELEKRQHDTMD